MFLYQHPPFVIIPQKLAFVNSFSLKIYILPLHQSLSINPQNVQQLCEQLSFPPTSAYHIYTTKRGTRIAGASVVAMLL